jgi:hypothetical protein
MDKEIEQILYQIAMDVAMDYQSELNALNINATGNLQNVDFEVDIKGGTYTISLILQDYWKYVENGRQPGKFPNIGKIQEWIKVKRIIPRPIEKKFKTKDNETFLPTEKQLAFMIANSIKENGIQPKPALANALKKNDTQLNRIKEAVSKSLDKEIKQMLKELNN